MSGDEKSLTPMMKQYMEVKAETPPDSVLLFRLGDFYEMFFDDARRASPVLDVALTKRAGTPMCGIPYHALDNYLPRLIEAGLKVAIAEQMEDPSLAKGIVRRGITRIISPGTVLDGNMLQPKRNNFLTALSTARDSFALAWLDISTGEFKAAEFNSLDSLEMELHRLQSKECVVPQSTLASWEGGKLRPSVPKGLLWTPLDDWIFSFENAESLLKRQFQAASLDGFGMKGMRLAVSASGAVLHYATESLKHSAGHVRGLRLHCPSDYLVLDPVCQRNLELVEPMPGGSRDGTLLHVLDRTCTPMGSRMTRDWILKPLRDIDVIVARQDVVGALKDDPMTLAELRETVGAVRDIERITAKLNVGSANARDMLALAHSLGMVPGVKSLISHYDLPLVESLRNSLHDLHDLTARILHAVADEPPATITDGGIIREGFNEELDSLRSAATEGKSWVASLQAKEQSRTGIKSLKVHFNKVFGYFIEITKSNLEHVPENYIRKQTLANCERFITPDLKEMESRILGAEDKSKALEQQLFEELRAYAATFTAQMQETAGSLAAVDVLASLAECAVRQGYCRPHVSADDTLDIRGGRHPALDCTMKSERFVPNDTLLDGDENRMMIITGPNMAGKSTYIRQTALLTIMAQIGSFVPADAAHIGVADRIFTRVGAADDISRGQSTFMVEMVETANILNHATAKSLVILDEIGRGTSTFDGLSIAWAVAEHLLDHPSCRARTMFATHYHELTELAITRNGVKNYNVAVREYGDSIIFLRQIVQGAADKSYGIHVAKLAGLPAEVISRAKEILENLEENAIADAGQPALTVKHLRERKAGYKPQPKKSGADSLQPSLFDL